jgi:glucose/mannose-6-phosphate isomerase
MGYEAMNEQTHKFPEFIRQGWEAAAGCEMMDKVSSIAVCGMGGSAISGLLLSSYLELDIPVFSVKGYELPSHIGKHALVFVVSYSGNTEEAISLFRSAMGRGSKIVGITSGGKLEKLCTESKVPCVLIPKGNQPRAALPLLFFSILRVLHNSRLVEDQCEYVEKAVQAVSSPVYSKMGEELAAKLKDRLVLVYSSERFGPVAYRWKTQLNENSKSMAFCNVLPELNHNEIVGFERAMGETYVVILQDEGDSQRLKKRMRLTKELLSEKGVSSTVISITGTCRLSRLFSAIYIGDYASLHLAGLYGLDPEQVRIIEDFKQQLK